MCGITGIYQYHKNIRADIPYIKWALQSMHHRGPDSNGIWDNGENYVAGFVRLSIRDLSENGSQPMQSDDGQYCISFNGEMYNTDAFKQRLIEKGVRFKSTTDTEVLLYGLIHWGAEYVLQQFDGIFAFAFYSHKQNKLILARDRSGIKPLYIGKCTEGVVYSSQYDHIINHDYFKNNPINAGAVGAYLSLGYVPENSGLIEGTYLLPHGYYAVVNKQGLNTYKFYQYPLQQTAAASTDLAGALEDSVLSQMVSDVPLGTFMSGGVDSPLVAYYANKHTNIKSFTIGVDDPNIDESKAAAAYADIFKTEHACKFITEKDLLQTMEDNTKAFSEPFADYSSIPTLILSQFAREKVTVALSGDGGDELFWGYPRNEKMLRQGLLFQQPKAVRWLQFVKEKLIGGKRTTIKRHLEVNDFPAFYYRSLFITGAEYWLPTLFKAKAAPAFFLDEVYENKDSILTDANSIMNVLRKLEFDIHLQRILIKVDRASMYHSLEVRVPVLSNSMIDYSTSLSYKDCIQHGIGKYNLKQLLVSKSSEDLVMRPKKGFIIPIGNWLRKELRKDVEDKLMNMPQELAVLFNRNELERLLREHMSGKQDWGWFIWALYALVNWNNHHRKSFKAPVA
jgi:asparagine synthase (glutamine-hydrolysing)